MAVKLPGGPDPVPGSQRTTRNAKVTVRPVRRKLPKPKNPKIVWYGRKKPTLDPNKYVVSKRGGGLGYVATKKPAAPAAAPTPEAPSPYATSDADINSQQLYHQSWVNNQVAPWLSQALTNLTGVDPNNPSINSTMQQQYLANVAGIVGGSLNSAAAATPTTIAATTPGGLVASPTAYLSRAASEAAAAKSSAMVDQARVQSALNTMQPNTQAQGYLYALADYAKGLPSVYADKRAEARSKIDDFLLEQQKMQLQLDQFAETQRHNKVQESISSQNAMTQAALGFGNLGLSTTREANDQTAVSTAAATPAPYGYIRDPATGDLVRDPSVPNASSSGGTSTKGTYTANQLRKEGFSPLPKGAGKAWQDKATVADDGSLWIKRGKPAKAAAGSKPKSAFNLSEDLIKKWRPSSGDGVELRFDNDPKGAGKWLAEWVRQYKTSFIKSGRKVDIAKLKQVLGSVGGRPAAEALSILTRGYIDANGNWK